jgi:hypothetical protein
MHGPTVTMSETLERGERQMIMSLRSERVVEGTIRNGRGGEQFWALVRGTSGQVRGAWSRRAGAGEDERALYGARRRDASFLSRFKLARRKG